MAIANQRVNLLSLPVHASYFAIILSLNIAYSTDLPKYLEMKNAMMEPMQMPI
ncbi:hypothetical protein SDC9_204607 [bioreactor metagenome]|uniref:Uncharacterized protein n=1 Tax=bioreactor metagenome TaxID=1076179 RepID=A0A645J8V6_9ZZZZ